MKRLNIRISDDDWARLDELRAVSGSSSVSDTMRDLIRLAHYERSPQIRRFRQLSKCPDYCPKPKRKPQKS